MSISKPLHELSIAESGAALRAGHVTSRALTDHALGRIGTLDKDLHAFVLVTRERALADADRADAELKNGIDHGPLHGVPYALKDIYDTAGIRTTCHSKLLIDNIPAEDSVVAAKLAAGGGVLMGKVGTHEFAIGGPSFDLPFPPARNPWNTDHVTSGSSSGSGAAVASGMVRMAMGSDTGGSIRGPAANCGIVGIKPTYGRVSRRGVFPLSYTLDHCGPLSWSVEDAALTMQVIAGHDPKDPASADVPVPDFTAKLGKDLRGIKVGYARDFFIDHPMANKEIVSLLDNTAKTLGDCGATVELVKLPAYDMYEACGRVIMFAEAYAIHEQNLKSRPMAYGRYTYQRIIGGAVLSAADYVQALRLRRELTDALNAVLSSHDVLLAPTSLTPAPSFDSFGPDAGRFAGMMNNPFNVTGSPALALPIGFSASGLPMGAQIVGRPFDEPTVFQVGSAYEAVADITHLRPGMPASLAA
ncbi:MAG TPA: amidase [Devosiaceae bacterium]|jgi:aspartyl-tRNA(Asn)/glutamyl-tRNA(Gln) amidotransferase subunit A|nr:amidase [Devosiaceae bacterium]